MELLSYISSLNTAVAALLLLAIFSYVAIFRNGEKRRYPTVVGTIFHQFYHVKRLHDYHTELSHKHKTYRLFAPAQRRLFTSDPAVIEYILKTNFHNYGKGYFNYENQRDLFGDGIFAVDGDKWRHQRKLASFDFSTKVLRDFSSVIFRKNAAKLAHIVSRNAEAKQTMEFQVLMMKATMDSIFIVAFGTELNCLDGSNKGSDFAKAFDDSSKFTMLRYVNLFWKIMKFLNIGSEAEFRKSIKVVDDFVYKLIHDRSDELSSKSHDSAEKQDILSRFLEQSKESGAVDYKYLRDIILNFVIAGKDTTAGALSWFLYMICKNPQAQDKVRQEVKEATKTNEEATIDEFSQSLNEEAFNKMHYLHAALTETLRLYPSVPLDIKVCFSDDVLPNGYNVSKDDIIYYQPYAMGRMEYLWGKDAADFRPERWLDENGVFQHESPFKFTAFQAGPRICLGKDFAYRQMKIFAAVLLRFFVFKLSDDNAPPSYKMMITLHLEDLHLNAFAT